MSVWYWAGVLVAAALMCAGVFFVGYGLGLRVSNQESRSK